MSTTVRHENDSLLTLWSIRNHFFQRRALTGNKENEFRLARLAHVESAISMRSIKVGSSPGARELLIRLDTGQACR
jgi:hypothetical protein